AASKALALDDALAEAHAALGFVKNHYDWDWPGAERELKRAIELNPNYATAHQWYSSHLEATGRMDEAIAESKKPHQPDPLSLSISATAGRTLYFRRRYEEATEQLGKALEMDPNFGLTHWILGMTYDQMARREEAIAECEKAVASSLVQPTALAALGHAYAVAGKVTEAQKALAQLKELSKQRYIAPISIAMVYAGLGDKAGAFEWLGRAYEDHSLLLSYIKVWPQFDGLHGDPRFQDLLRRMGLKP